MPLNTKALKISALSAFSALVAVTAAQAGDNVSFSYKTSELESTTGVSSLYQRIENRAENLCAADARALYAKKTAETCTENLVDDWVTGISDSRLNRLHAQNGAPQVASAN